jgi:hypothetical protein
VTDSWRGHLLVIAAASAVAVVSARPYAGGWNDGSRLASVECLVDYGTWAIDNSIFVNVPADSKSQPYDEADPALNLRGTRDRLWIDGHFYSDKSPVPALFMAGEYMALQRFTGLTARDAPDSFCRWITILSSGLAYVIAVWCIFRLGAPLGLPRNWRLALTASFALATVAPIYSQQVNNHVLLLAIASALTAELAWLSAGHAGVRRLALIGTLAGLGYTVDLGVGPILLFATAILIAIRFWRRPAAVLLAGCAALPWVALHHMLNYSIGGTFGPANTVAAYLDWPGSPFTAQSMTGGWNHPSFTRFVLYALDMLFGKRGIIGHDLALFLVVIAAPSLGKIARRERPELWHALGWSLGSWLLYAATSTNSAGVCCSIRWLVPLLAPSYFALAILLRDHPQLRPDFVLLGVWSALYSGFLLAGGPWREIAPLTNWLMMAGAGASWIVLRRVIASRTTIATPLVTTRAA